MKKATRKIIAACNSVINIAVMVFLVLLLIIGCYVLWDTKIVHTVGNKGTWKAYKPSANNTLSYDELRKINPDVIGWISIYGTAIDFPVVQSLKDTNYYLFRDPTGKLSSVGSIFMDKDCSRDFSDFKSIIYGHHMEAHAMFGDLDLFKNQKFFNDHKYGNLYFDDKDHGLVVIGYINTKSNDSKLYRTEINGSFERQEQFTIIRQNSQPWRDTAYDFAMRLVLLSTCSNSSTEARTVLVTLLTDETYENTFDDDGFIWPGVEDLEGWLGFPWTGWFVALIVIVIMVAYILAQKDKKKKAEKANNNKYGKYL